MQREYYYCVAQNKDKILFSNMFVSSFFFYKHLCYSDVARTGVNNIATKHCSVGAGKKNVRL